MKNENVQASSVKPVVLTRASGEISAHNGDVSLIRS